jgi:cystathionine gamma-synthase
MSQTVEQPLCHASDLGNPIPPSPHAVSVCLPTWEDNIGYERADPRVVGRMQCGYPRFFVHPLVARLFEVCEQRFAKAGERCFAFPSRRVAERCRDFVRREKGLDSRIDALDGDQAFSICVPAPGRDVLKAYWQHTGQIVSSRRAEQILAGVRSTGDATNAKRLLRERLAGLMAVDPADVWLFPSGMAAIETAFRAFQRVRPAAKSVQFGFPYVDSLKLQERLGVGAHFFPRGAAREFEELAATASREPILGLFCEFPGNPLLSSPDLAAIERLSRAHEFPVLVDDTLGALVNVDVLPAADVVSCSLTKFFSGAGDVMGGSLVINPRRPGAARLRAAIDNEYEDLLYVEDAVVLERNSRDCCERARLINRTAERVCDMLCAHPAVARVDYPKFTTPENFRAFSRPGCGYGGLFSLLLHNPERCTPRFFDALQIAKGPNLGTNFSLCCPYTILAHYQELDFVERCGISRYLVRVSIGLEDPEWLIGRFREALAAAVA